MKVCAPPPFLGGMLVVPHRVAAGQRFGLGSGPVGHDVELLGEFYYCDLTSPAAVGSQTRSAYIRAKVALWFFLFVRC